MYQRFQVFWDVTVMGQVVLGVSRNRNPRMTGHKV
jgi:hypothetical protein